jgi:hypothetical protein
MRLRIPRIPHVRTVAEIVGAVLLLSTGAASAAAIIPAATPATIIHGCENTTTGALSVRLGPTCPAGTKGISWNKTGPAGPPGTAGIFGKNTNEALEARPDGLECTIGQVLLTAGAIMPGDTLPANGARLPISQFTPLFELLGTKYGGNGKTNFALPNLKKAAPDGMTYSICYAGIFPTPN